MIGDTPGVHAIVKSQHIGLIPTPLLHAYGGGELLKQHRLAINKGS